MRAIERLLGEYAESHRNATNKLIHWICVPAIVWTVVALLWEIPFPGDFNLGPIPVNWATLVLLAALVYWFRLSVPLGIGLVAVVAALIALTAWLDRTLATPLWIVAVVVFIVAWIGQFIGHAIEGKRPSFFKDVQFLMIGPAWLLAFVYRKLGIAY